MEFDWSIKKIQLLLSIDGIVVTIVLIFNTVINYVRFLEKNYIEICNSSSKFNMCWCFS